MGLQQNACVSFSHPFFSISAQTNLLISGFFWVCVADAEPGGSPPPPQSKGGKSIRGGKLARRARSFKEDFLDKLSNIRSNPRSQSPHSPKMPTKPTTNGDLEEPANPLRELDQLVKQVL
jgi:hypothetical protein